MEIVDITEEDVKLVLTQPRSSVRIAYENGTHVRKPTTERKKVENKIEWMITNNEISLLVKNFLKEEGKKELVEQLKKIKNFIEYSKYVTRETIKTTTEKLDTFEDFDIYKYSENFSSFERNSKSGITIRITFKAGDYTDIAAHMYVLLSFGHPSLLIKNNKEEVQMGRLLGSKCLGIWTPSDNDICEFAKSLSIISKKHRDDLIRKIIS
jgi:hypothetical protein